MSDVSEITRTGPPTPRAVKGRIFTWTVTLSDIPPGPWKNFFTHTKDTSVTCSPEHVRFYQATAIFESDEVGVPTWIEFIDKWAASATERYAKYAEEERLQRGAADDLKKDPAQRLREAAERFKHL